MKGIPELPLLRRELTELANRKRTYIIRFVGALVILSYVFFVYHNVMQVTLNRPLQIRTNPMLGVGGHIFTGIVSTLFIAIQIMMPALCCAAIAHEKESNTIGTLLLTKLSPFGIVLEKFLSRIIPMITLLLLTFPVLAHVFSLGGVDTSFLLGTIWLLLCECLLLGSLALLCSAWFPTTIGAFIGTYVLIAIMLILIFPMQLQTWIPSSIWQSTYSPSPFGPPTQPMNGGDPTFLMHLFDALGLSSSSSSLVLIFARSIPALLLTAAFLLMTRFLLVRRAFTSSSSMLLVAFRSVDRFFQWLNHRTTGGIELARDKDNYPVDDPIAWRERTKKSLGKVRYLFRILVVLMTPTLFICSLVAISSAQRSFEGLHVLLGILWALAAMIVCMKAATLLVSERARQTLESLLACPLSGREILVQKISGMRRLIIVMSTPVLTVHLTLYLVQMGLGSSSGQLLMAVSYPVLSVCNTFLILSLIAWLSAGIGLMFHSQIKAVMTSMFVVAICILGPWLLLALSESMLVQPFWQVALLSPVSLVVVNEAALINANNSLPNFIGSFGYMPISFVAMALTFCHFVALMAIRSIVISRLPSLLGRRESSATSTRSAQA